MLYPKPLENTVPTPAQAAFNKFLVNDNGIRGTIAPLSDENFNLLWHVGPDYMPQDILDLIGTDAVTLFKASAALDQFRAIIDPTYVPKTLPYPVTFNADGSVTATVPPYVPPVIPTPVQPMTVPPVIPTETTATETIIPPVTP